MRRIPSLGPRGEGWLLLQVVLMVLIAVGGLLGPRAISTDDPAAGSARIVGQVTVLAGLALIVWASTTLRASGSFAAVPRPRIGGNLVESGPYRLVRHPLYAGLVVAGIGAALTRLSWNVLVLTIALFLVLDLKRRREEAWLLERYPGYAGYRDRTKALIPFIY